MKKALQLIALITLANTVFSACNSQTPAMIARPMMQSMTAKNQSALRTQAQTGRLLTSSYRAHHMGFGMARGSVTFEDMNGKQLQVFITDWIDVDPASRLTVSIAVPNSNPLQVIEKVDVTNKTRLSEIVTLLRGLKNEAGANHAVNLNAIIGLIEVAIKQR